MKKWKERWNEMLPYEKKFEVATYVLVCHWLVFFVLDILAEFGVLAISFDAYEIARLFAALAMGCQAVVYWRRKRGTAIFFLILGILWGRNAIWEIVKLFI
jgi:uncharacterized membrane protein YjjB (DUF3815 family)